MAKLIKSVIEKIQPEARDVFLWDDTLTGFGLRVLPSGKRSFVLQYRNKEGRSRRITLGRFDVLTVQQARERAIRRLAEVSDGGDPAEEKHKTAVAPTVSELAENGRHGGSFEHGTAYVPVDLSGAALWLPPGVHPNDEALETAMRDGATPEHLDDLLSTFEKMEQSHPEEPHWYLTVIGVDPNAQGSGLGGALMRHAVARCDHEGALAYLESSNPRNIALYERHGFQKMGEIQVGAAPLVTPMVRRPR